MITGMGDEKSCDVTAMAEIKHRQVRKTYICILVSSSFPFPDPRRANLPYPVFYLDHFNHIQILKEMEGISASVYTKMKQYWKRQGYHRIGDGSSARNQRAELGRRRRRMSWRIKIKPKLKFKSLDKPNKFMVWLRDAYVRMMLGFASSAGGGMVGDGVSSLGRKAVKEYDEKMVVLEFYKSLVLARSNRN